jgi:hypothetical protein
MPGSFSHMPHRGKSLVAKKRVKKNIAPLGQHIDNRTFYVLPQWGNALHFYFVFCYKAFIPGGIFWIVEM